nr:hypothetical protein [Neobacillus vireti]
MAVSVAVASVVVAALVVAAVVSVAAAVSVDLAVLASVSVLFNWLKFREKTGKHCFISMWKDFRHKIKEEVFHTPTGFVK